MFLKPFKLDTFKCEFNFPFLTGNSRKLKDVYKCKVYIIVCLHIVQTGYNNWILMKMNLSLPLNHKPRNCQHLIYIYIYTHRHLSHSSICAFEQTFHTHNNYKIFEKSFICHQSYNNFSLSLSLH